MAFFQSLHALSSMMLNLIVLLVIQLLLCVLGNSELPRGLYLLRYLLIHCLSIPKSVGCACCLSGPRFLLLRERLKFWRKSSIFEGPAFFFEWERWDNFLWWGRWDGWNKGNWCLKRHDLSIVWDITQKAWLQRQGRTKRLSKGVKMPSFERKRPFRVSKRDFRMLPWGVRG